MKYTFRSVPSRPVPFCSSIWVWDSTYLILGFTEHHRSPIRRCLSPSPTLQFHRSFDIFIYFSPSFTPVTGSHSFRLRSYLRPKSTTATSLNQPYDRLYYSHLDPKIYLAKVSHIPMTKSLWTATAVPSQHQDSVKKLDNSSDRISELSDEVLLHILSLLTLKQATATSVLSTRWRNLWLPYLASTLMLQPPLREELDYESCLKTKGRPHRLG
ncbi:F-box/FBD/LRR-repeat protein At1g16930 [Linum perenne]